MSGADSSGKYELLDGRFELLERIGSGGFASVWFATDLKSKYPIIGPDGNVDSGLAIKILLNLPGREDQESWDQFCTEAAAGITLDGKYVARSFEIIDLRDFPVWKASAAIVMRRIEPSLDRVVKQLAGKIPKEVGIEFAKHLATALCDLHAKGLVHRDIKPANVLIQLAAKCSWIDPNPDCLTGATALLADFGFIAWAAKEPKIYLMQDGWKDPNLFEPRCEIEDLPKGKEAFGRRVKKLCAKREPVNSTEDIFAFGLVLREINQALDPPLPALAAVADCCMDPDPRNRPEANEELIERIGSCDLEGLLHQHADQVAAQWDRLRNRGPQSSQTERDENETHRFDCYVQPDYRIERPRSAPDQFGAQQQQSGSEDALDAPIPDDGDKRLRNLLSLMLDSAVWEDAPEWLREAQRSGRWLVVYDKAGAGKTVFSYKMMQVAASKESRQLLFNHRAPLVVRWEKHWPRRNDDRLMPIREAIQHQFTQEMKFDPKVAAKCVELALRENRVLVILDGLDQFSAEDRGHLKKLLADRANHNPGPLPETDLNDASGCRWIITSRVHTIEQSRPSVFTDSRFLRVRIDPFSPAQQDEYFAIANAQGHGNGPHWLQTIGITDPASYTSKQVRKRMDELLQLPMTLRLIRQLIELPPVGQPLPVFQTLSELSLRVSRERLKRALATSTEELTKKGLAGLELSDDARVRLLEHVLSLMAFQLMLERNYNGHVTGSDLAGFEKRCKDRWFKKLDALLRQKDLPRRKELELEEQVKKQLNQWDWALAVLKTIELNYREVTEAYGPAGLTFRSRKTVETLAARYLTRYATEWDVFGNDDHEDLGEDIQTRCAWDFSNDSDWKDCWILAIEMPRQPLPHGDTEEAMDPVVTLCSLRALFRLPKQEIRPTELIYRCWHLFEIDDLLLRQRLFLVNGTLKYGDELPDAQRLHLGRELLLPGAKSVLDEFRAPSRELVQEMKTNTLKQERLAKDLGHDQWLKKWQEQSSRTKSRTFVSIPPVGWMEQYKKGDRANDPCTGLMGANLKSGAPEHSVRIARFQMLATPVTRGMYRIFDPTIASEGASWRLDVIAESEYANPPKDAKTAEAERDQCPIVMSNWYDSWVFCKWLDSECRLPTGCQYEFGIRGGRKRHYLYDVITKQKLGDYAWSNENSEGHPRAVGRLLSSGYGLFDGPAQMWEWSCDWYDYGWYSKKRRSVDWSRAFVEDFGPSAGSHRVIHGGSWSYVVEYVAKDVFVQALDRSEFRRLYKPTHRSYGVGFRVVCLLSVE